MNRNESVIVIRSLVPGGVAQLDGRLLPGDRLLSVNDHNLENATLEQAVQTLKGAPKGVVVVGVAKPLPLPDSGSSGGSGNPSRSASKNKDEETAEDCTYQVSLSHSGDAQASAPYMLQPSESSTPEANRF